ncbi:glycosyl hydrolase family 8 [Roseomonas sp. CCTCC AB2023176]|uniref:glycosyl hydrolase family 8 n=1 Tax=Roseomonas sp. CCTCC AB2023176 TaxID=3342640 RepID=UPI0035D65BE8
MAMTFGRRTWLAGAATLAVQPLGAQPLGAQPLGVHSLGAQSLGVPPAARPSDGEWSRFKARFLAPDGRVVDTGNNNQSHSEGQGWGLLLAVHHDDRPAFDSMLRWTRSTLRRDGDLLHTWRWMPTAVPIQDRNNATDGDLFIAASLVRGGARWSDPSLTEEGIAVARDVLRLLVRRVDDMLVLLPGARGFEHRSHVVLNPSYYALPAIATLAEALPDPAWLRVVTDGLRLLRGAQFGRWGLPPDWIAVSRLDGRVTPAQGWPARFAYDAVRIPLWLSWVGLGEEPCVVRPATFWADEAHRYLPAWADLTTDATSPYPAGPGMAGVARLAALRGNVPVRRGLTDARGDGRDYYDTALGLLARMAQSESG